ncbi:MAG: 23S rRNA (guanosine(2251)-2'-O)-methyltransferase RlmB [Mycoplasma sp.]
MKNQNFIIGKKAIVDAISNNVKIKTIFALDNEFKKINPKVNIEIVSKNFFNRFNEVNHQFIVAEVVQEISYLGIDEVIKKHSSKDKSTILMLDEIEDPGNFGAIIRTAVALGVDAIIYKNTHQAQINETVIKTSTGGVYYIDFVKVANLTNCLEKLKKALYWTYATALNDRAINLNTVEFDNKAVIIVGNEQRGISQIVEKNSDFIVKIPMSSNLQSLNVSVATGIVLSTNFKKY